MTLFVLLIILIILSGVAIIITYIYPDVIEKFRIMVEGFLYN